MKVSELIVEWLRRQNMEVKDFAAKSGISQTLISNAKNETGNPITFKTLFALFQATGLELEDCLTLPPDPATASQDDKILHEIKMALRHEGQDRQRVIDCYENIQRSKRESRKKTGTDPAVVHR